MGTFDNESPLVSTGEVCAGQCPATPMHVSGKGIFIRLG
jgi:hypothetical protein